MSSSHPLIQSVLSKIIKVFAIGFYCLLFVNSFTAIASDSEYDKELLQLAPNIYQQLLQPPPFPPSNHSEIAANLFWQWTPDPKNLCHGQFLEPLSLTSGVAAPFQTTPFEITAAGPVTLQSNGVSTLNKVIATQPGRIIIAQKAIIVRNPKTQAITRIEFMGRVHFFEHGELVIANSATFIPPNLIDLDNTYFRNLETPPLGIPSWGQSRKVNTHTSYSLSLENNTYTTCSPLEPAWLLHTKHLYLNKNTEIGKAYNTWVTFYRLPIFFSPYLSFPLTKKRKSGFLTPVLGYTTSSGDQLGLRYYWNMLPNADDTFSPVYFSERGWQLNNELRWITPESKNSLDVAFLPYDRKFAQFRDEVLSAPPVIPDEEIFRQRLAANSNARGFLQASNEVNLTEHLSTTLALNLVSDDYYMRDFIIPNLALINNTQVNELLNSWSLTYSGENGSLGINTTGFQTLYPLAPPAQLPIAYYQYLPEITSDFSVPFANTPGIINWDGEFANFKYNNPFLPPLPVGQRFFMQPGFSWPIVSAAAFITPQIQFNYLAESLQQIDPPMTPQMTRSLPIFNVDSGLYLQRNFHIGSHAFTQTLQPRLYYLYVPFVNQDDLPVFDTILPPYTFLTLNTTNQFWGVDRQQNANQLDLSVVSTLLAGADNQPVLTGGLGIIRYFAPNRVSLPFEMPEFVEQSLQEKWSPILATLTGSLGPYVKINSQFAWNQFVHKWDTVTTGLVLQVDPRRVMSVNFQNLRNYTITNGTEDYTRTITAGAAWPLIIPQLEGLAFENYDLFKRQTISYFIGAQFDTCCWGIRFITQRALITPNLKNQPQYATGYYLQFELKGLGSIGNSGLSLISQIPGLAAGLDEAG